MVTIFCNHSKQVLNHMINKLKFIVSPEFRIIYGSSLPFKHINYYKQTKPPGYFPTHLRSFSTYSISTQGMPFSRADNIITKHFIFVFHLLIYWFRNISPSPLILKTKMIYGFNKYLIKKPLLNKSLVLYKKMRKK